MSGCINLQSMSALSTKIFHCGEGVKLQFAGALSPHSLHPHLACLFLSLSPSPSLPPPHTDTPRHTSVLSRIILADGSESKIILLSYFVNHDQIYSYINLYHCSFFEHICLSNSRANHEQEPCLILYFTGCLDIFFFRAGYKLRLQSHKKKKPFHHFLDEAERN